MKFSTPFHYNALDEVVHEQKCDDSNFSHPLQSRARHHTRRKIIVATIIFATSAFSLLALYQWWAFTGISQCGTTASEARAKGCVFETLGFSWLPPECHDAEVEAEFLRDPTIHYWRDVNRTEEVPISEVQEGDARGFYITHDYHRSHCAYLLKKLHRAVYAGRELDGLIGSVHHTSHCVKMLLDPPADVWTHPTFVSTHLPKSVGI